MQSFAFLFVVKKTFIPRNAHKHILRNVDLHEDQNLVERSECITHGRQIDPLIAIDTEKMLFGAFLLSFVHDEVACGHCEHWN